MKKLLMILFITPIFSCSVETVSQIDSEITGEWVLVQTSGQVADSVKTGSELPFQESYTLQEHGTFTKTRINNGKVLKSTGTFEVSEISSELENSEVKVNIIFHHESPNEIIATCYSSSLREVLFLNTRGALIGTHNACDGIGLKYEQRTKHN